MGTIWHHTDVENDTATFTGTGLIRMADVQQAAMQQMAEAVTGRVIWDFRQVAIADASLSTMRDLVRATRVETPERAGRRVALIVGKQIHAVMGRLYLSAVEQMSANSEHAVFLNLKEANIWLHRETETAEPTNILPFAVGAKSNEPVEKQDVCG